MKPAILCLLLVSSSLAATHPQIPAPEAAILTQVAAEYQLTPWQTRLLLAIRLAENGGPGIEMGVMPKGARRYRDDPAASLRLQAQWAAGTIKRRCPGPESLEAFSKRYCPPNHKWWARVVAEKAAGVQL